ncbi:MAG: hypothetical protein AABX07_02895 [Nanoarchaeota archaeon]
MEDKAYKLKVGRKTDYQKVMQYVMITILVVLLVYNVSIAYGQADNSSNGLSTGIGIVSASEIIPKGTPKIYGAEIGVKYDDVNAANPGLADATIRKLSAYENKELTSVQMERYIKIGTSISCEYCCGAESIIFSNGQKACGCAHSYAMRGLAKYLLINHPDMSNDEILSEMGKWKVLFFPGIHEQKAQVLKAKGIDEKNYINLASNLYRGVEQGQTTGADGMVGGC